MGLFVTKMTAHDAIKEINREREDSPHGNRLTSYTQNSINGLKPLFSHIHMVISVHIT